MALSTHKRLELTNKAIELSRDGMSTVDIAKLLNVPRTTISDWINKNPLAMMKEAERPILPDFGDPDMPIEDLIEHITKYNKKRIEHENKKKWFTIKAPVKGPFALMFFGDPHVDDNHCNWELLRKHIGLVKDHDRIYGINIGDTHNNWIGRLEKLYKDQQTTQSDAYRLADWFMFKSGIKWLVWLLGNHCVWGDGMARMKAMGGHAIIMENWRAQFKIECYNGREVLIDAAHDHKGHSMYNELHAQEKVATMEKTPHLAIAGHRHHPALKKKWLPAEGMVTWLARVGTYKWHDSHSKVNGFYDYQAAPAMLAIIDPDADDSHIMFVTDDIELGIEILNIKIAAKNDRSKH